MNRSIALVVLLTACGTQQRTQPHPLAAWVAPHSTSRAPQGATLKQILSTIAREIEDARDRFPQLAEFRATRHGHLDRLTIDYGYHTHAAQRVGGWAAGVPNPDRDGIWFYVDFHDPSSTAQIHTQPMVPDMWLRDKKVMVLILEGTGTRSFSATLFDILRQNGVTMPP